MAERETERAERRTAPHRAPASGAGEIKCNVVPRRVPADGACINDYMQYNSLSNMSEQPHVTAHESQLEVNPSNVVCGIIFLPKHQNTVESALY